MHPWRILLTFCPIGASFFSPFFASFRQFSPPTFGFNSSARLSQEHSTNSPPHLLNSPAGFRRSHLSSCFRAIFLPPDPSRRSLLPTLHQIGLQRRFLLPRRQRSLRIPIVHSSRRCRQTLPCGSRLTSFSVGPFPTSSHAAKLRIDSPPLLVLPS